MKPPERLVESYFVQYAEGAKRRSDGIWNGGCPICHEGTSWGTKHRLFWLPDRDMLHCHNCNRTWSSLRWMMEVSGKPYEDIRREFDSYEFVVSRVPRPTGLDPRPSVPLPKALQQGEDRDLPYMTIMLDDKQQMSYYSGDPMVREAVEYVRSRRLDTAYNAIPYGFTEKDYVHRNRLVIPFRDLDGTIPFYQTRLIRPDESNSAPKYLSKKDAQKSVFGIDHVDSSIHSLYITEGPIDSCFVPNGVSMAGLVTTQLQESQMSRFWMSERVWILDNDFRTNPDVLKKYVDLIKRGERVFIWPSAFNSYKDINEICVANSMDSLPHKLFDKYSYRGREAAESLKRAVYDFKKENKEKNQ